MAEFGLIAAQGLHKVAELIAIVRDVKDERVPDMARQVLRLIADQIAELNTRIAAIEAQIMAWHKSNAMSQRLATIPGIGPIIATAIEPGEFHSGREFAAWLGLVPPPSMVMNSRTRRPPQRIVNAYPLDQRVQVRVDSRPASKGAGFPPSSPTSRRSRPIPLPVDIP